MKKEFKKVKSKNLRLILISLSLLIFLVGAFILIRLNDKKEDIKSDLAKSNKIIVKSDNVELENYTQNQVESYGDFVVLAFDNQEDSYNAYKTLNQDKNSLVDIDSVMEIQLEDEGTEDNGENKISEIDSSESTDEDYCEETELSKYLDKIEATKFVKVAIIDTGIDLNNIDYKDKVIDLGINYSTSGEENSIQDDNGHGTEIANIIMQNANDKIRIMPIKVANSEGKADILSVYNGIQKAIEKEADVINISMNAYRSSKSEIIEEAINKAISNGIIVVVSAGNNNTDVKNVIPSNMDEVISVSAVTKLNEKADYSNYGETIDYTSYGEYNGKNGTSYAAANVTEIIADVLSKNLDIEGMNSYVIDIDNNEDNESDEYLGKGLISRKYYYIKAQKDIENLVNNIVIERKDEEENNEEENKESEAFNISSSSGSNYDYFTPTVYNGYSSWGTVYVCCYDDYPSGGWNYNYHWGYSKDHVITFYFYASDPKTYKIYNNNTTVATALSLNNRSNFNWNDKTLSHYLATSSIGSANPGYIKFSSLNCTKNNITR